MNSASQAGFAGGTFSGVWISGEGREIVAGDQPRSNCAIEFAIEKFDLCHLIQVFRPAAHRIGSCFLQKPGNLDGRVVAIGTAVSANQRNNYKSHNREAY